MSEAHGPGTEIHTKGEDQYEYTYCKGQKEKHVQQKSVFCFQKANNIEAHTVELADLQFILASQLASVQLHASVFVYTFFSFLKAKIPQDVM